MSIWPFRRSRAEQDAGRLLTAVTAVARRPGFFGPDKAPDTLEGRFEIITLVAALALFRLQREAGAQALAQAFTDKLFSQFDAGLREAAVGDTAVPKRMRKMAGAFYGRLDAYGAALETGDEAALRAAIARNVLGDENATFAAEIAKWTLEAARWHEGAAIPALFEPDHWPALMN
jgi:cytochrome b pre-mRNA-processing protein 3